MITGYPSLWVISKPAALFRAELNLINTSSGTLISTAVVYETELLDTLISRVPPGRTRVPRFSTQPATVLENWV